MLGQPTVRPQCVSAAVNLRFVGFVRVLSLLNAEWSPERGFWGAGGGGGGGVDDDDVVHDVFNVLKCRVDILGTGGWVRGGGDVNK